MVPPFQYSLSHNHLSRSVISSFLRGFSTSPASSEEYEVGFFSGHRANRYRSIEEEEEEVSRYVPVKAYFLSTRYSVVSSIIGLKYAALYCVFSTRLICYFNGNAHKQLRA
jgi:hypothetical protein